MPSTFFNPFIVASLARSKGSKDGKKRERTKKSAADKRKDAEAKSQKKAADEATQRARNATNFRTSLFGPYVAAPPHLEPTVDENDAVELHGIPCWTEQVDPKEIRAELGDNLGEDDDQEYDDADTSDAPKNILIRQMRQQPV